MNAKNYPRHLALILDGNRRWGLAHGVKMNVNFYMNSGGLGLEVAQHVLARGIDNLTIWIGSVANLTARPAIEVRALNRAYRQFFEDEANLTFAHENRVKIDCFGRWRELLEPATVRAIEKIMTATAEYADSGRRLTVLIAYSGTDERGAALEKVLASAGDISLRAGSGLNDYTNLLRQNSWTGHLPDVDLIIRTGCGTDPHNSAGFLSLLADNTQLAFLETLWPDFTTDMLDEILDEFAGRERRLGK
jgi:undecaprenyl diphosphate synthase